jgi:hypothetical protein
MRDSAVCRIRAGHHPLTRLPAAALAPTVAASLYAAF